MWKIHGLRINAEMILAATVYLILALCWLACRMTHLVLRDVVPLVILPKFKKKLKETSFMLIRIIRLTQVKTWTLSSLTVKPML